MFIQIYCWRNKTLNYAWRPEKVIKVICLISSKLTNYWQCYVRERERERDEERERERGREQRREEKSEFCVQKQRERDREHSQVNWPTGWFLIRRTTIKVVKKIYRACNFFIQKLRLVIMWAIFFSENNSLTYSYLYSQNIIFIKKVNWVNSDCPYDVRLKLFQ